MTPILQAMASLHIALDESDFDQRFDLAGELVTIGRSTSCTISIDHRSLSRAHARLSLQGSHWIVEDLDSTNGSFLNNQRLTGSRVLEHDDVLILGTARLIFCAPEHAKAKSSYDAHVDTQASSAQRSAIEHKMSNDETDTMEIPRLDPDTAPPPIGPVSYDPFASHDLRIDL